MPDRRPASTSRSQATATAQPRSQTRASPPTPAGRAESSARGATSTAAYAHSGRAPSNPTPTTATSTSAEHRAPTRSPTASRPCSPAQPAHKNRDLLLVEGVLDVHILRAHGNRQRRSTRRHATSHRLFEQLADLGIPNVTLALDNDAAGLAATTRAIDASIRAVAHPHIWIIDPDLLGNAKDPGELVRAPWPRGWTQATAAPICGITARALDLTGPLPELDARARETRQASNAPAPGSHPPPAHAIEQTAALDAVADTLGYDTEPCDAFSADAIGDTSPNEPSTRRARTLIPFGEATARPARHRIVPRHQELREIAG